MFFSYQKCNNKEFENDEMSSYVLNRSALYGNSYIMSHFEKRGGSTGHFSMSNSDSRNQ